MKRTTLWVTLAATGVQIAALGLCVWAMQSSRDGNRALAKPRPREALPQLDPVAPIAAAEPPAAAAAPQTVAAGAAQPSPAVEPIAAEPPIAEPIAAEPPIAEPIAAEPPIAQPIAAEPPFVEPAAHEPLSVVPAAAEPIHIEIAADEAIHAEPAAAEPTRSAAIVEPLVPHDPPIEIVPYVTPGGSSLSADTLDTLPDIWADPETRSAASTPPASLAEDVVPPPMDTAVAASPPSAARPVRAIPRFITNFADEQTQIVVAEEGDPPIVFGLFADGSVRCVDVDNGCYAGKAEGSRSRMREVAGSRAFTVQLEPDDDGGFTASFVGGLHDAQHLTLLPVVTAGHA